MSGESLATSAESSQDFTLDGIRMSGPFYLEFIGDDTYLSFCKIENDEANIIRTKIDGKIRSKEDAKNFVFYSV